jgi:hypothetical protein
MHPPQFFRAFRFYKRPSTLAHLAFGFFKEAHAPAPLGGATRPKTARPTSTAACIARIFLGGRPWYEVLDFELRRKASYFFLRPAAETPCLSGPGPQDPQDELPESPERAGQVVSTKPVFFDPAVLEVKRARRPTTRFAAASAAKKSKL